MRPLSFKLSISESNDQISCEIIEAPNRMAVMVLAHGAGAGMHHQFMVSLAHALSNHNISTIRFQFPYMENGKKRPDTPEVAKRSIRTVISEAFRRYPDIPVYAGGKSFGGRMISLLAAEDTGEFQLSGLVYYGFPLHPPGKPSTTRADHLKNIPYPMLFFQGTRDKLADPTLVTQVIAPLKNATLNNLQGADHSFHMLKSSGVTDAEILQHMAKQTSNWISQNMLVEK